MNKRNLFISNFERISFAGKFLLFILMIVLYLNNRVIPQYTGGYNSSLIDKVKRLESVESPKIVLLGDSNLTFGINSSMIEDELGMPVVNMGLHKGAGNPFHEEMSKLNVQKNDIYIICHTTYSDDDTLGELYTWISIENHFHLWEILRAKDIIPMMKAFPCYLKRCLNLYASGTGNIDDGTMYSRSAFNEYGDITLSREKTEYEFTEKIIPASINDITIHRINKLNQYLEQRGATLLVAGYPIGNGELTANANEFIEFQRTLSEQLDCAVISNYVDYMLNYSYFYDTAFHLTSEGADIRTRQLISDIKRWQHSGTDLEINSDHYEDILKDVNLSHISDLNQYLSFLLAGKDRYTIFICAEKGSIAGLNENTVTLMEKLGLEVLTNDTSWINYLAIVEQGNILEQTDLAMMNVSGNTADGYQHYSIQNNCYDCGSPGAIIINGQEYSVNHPGLSIIVYSNESHRILDEVSFDTATQNTKAIR